ncbi:MAG: hypothetical protein V1736_11670, partial [Pseudomonadota bacterium]
KLDKVLSAARARLWPPSLLAFKLLADKTYGPKIRGYLGRHPAFRSRSSVFGQPPSAFGH